VTAYEVWTNYTSPGAYRLPPGPHPAFAANVFYDMIAGKLGMNPVTMLQNNSMYVVGDKNQLTNYPYYSIGQPAVLNQVLSLTNFMTKWKKAPASPSGLTGVVHGIGIANANGGNGSTASSHSTCVVMQSDGSLLVSSGGTDIGEGRTEEERILAAEFLGLPIDYVAVANNDSEFIGDTGATVGSSQTKGAGNCIVLACADAKNQMMTKAATSLKTTVDKLTYALDGSMKIYLTSDPTQYVTFASLTGEPGIIGVGRMVAPSGVSGNVFCTTVAEVDVDTDTGLVTVTNLTEVIDCGQIIFRASIEGQVQGAMIQAMGQAIQEETWIDIPTGGLIGSSHLDDKDPLFPQVPPLQTGFVEDQEAPPLSYNFGAKGMGEPPIASPVPAICNAVANAIGWWPTTLPVTPDKVLKALGKA
jgi:CO/xanthine dehydrogenase Mo-binding subunit